MNMKKIKFFNKNIEKRCEYCLHSQKYEGIGEILCNYKGAVEPDHHCRRFKYDILKRQPKKLRTEDTYTADDFAI